MTKKNMKVASLLFMLAFVLLATKPHPTSAVRDATYLLKSMLEVAGRDSNMGACLIGGSPCGGPKIWTPCCAPYSCTNPRSGGTCEPPIERVSRDKNVNMGDKCLVGGSSCGGPFNWTPCCEPYSCSNPRSGGTCIVFPDALRNYLA